MSKAAPRFSRSRFVREFVATLSIITLLFSAIIFPGLVKARAENGHNADRTSPAIKHAPPEPFIISTRAGDRDLGGSISIFFASATVSLLGYFGVSADTKTKAEFEHSEVKNSKKAIPVNETNGNLSGAITSAPPPTQPSGAVDFDFDGDGKSDRGRWHASNTEFKVKNSNGGSFSTYYTVGSSGGVPAPADYDGDGITDVAVFNAGTWKIRTSGNSTISTISGFGQAGDLPMSGNYGNSSADELAYFRPSNGTWYWREFSNSTVYSQAWGVSGDIPAAGDFNGDGVLDLTIFRPSTGYWWVNNIGSFAWGVTGDVPVPADFDGDGTTDPTVFRPSDGTWYSLKSSASFASWSTQVWGFYGDQPVAGDFDGDSKADYAIWRPTSGTWYIIYSSNWSFQIETLGVPGDFAIPSAYVKQVGAAIAPDEISKARLSPKNARGETDLYSRNFAWSRPLVSLPGRSGLDLSLGLSYNSLVWTKVGSNVLFDTDVDNVSPGFRLAFPTIEPAYYDDDTDLYNYLMVTPSGRRVQFRATAASNTYETVDSSYARLVTTGASNPNDPVEDITIKVTDTDGMQMSYVWRDGAFRCSEIKDRNGNYITISYNDYGLASMTDTLGRVITINYDAYLTPSSITQTWRADNGHGSTETQPWASFSYTTKEITTNFDGVAVWGPPNGTDLRVLEKVTFLDGSSTKFYYNDYGQVSKVENIAADSHVLNYVSTDLDSPESTPSDCPRFSETRTKVENFNMSGSPATPQEVIVTNTTTLDSSFSLASGSHTGDATLVTLAMSNHPDGLIKKMYFGESGWKEGLLLATEDCTGGTCSNQKRWTWNDWYQDFTVATYPFNPHIVETQVGDGTNTKRTTIAYYYHALSELHLANLPTVVKVYDSDLTTVLKTQITSYNFDSNYLSKRIIGLPTETELWQGLNSSGTLMSKVMYGYDEGGYSGTGQSLSSATQHDDASYGTGFAYRGNLTSKRRWDASAPTTESVSVISSMKYNIAGSPISQTTPFDGSNTRTVSIGYTDSWNDTPSPNRTTYAYPTTITDPGGFSSTIKYRYDIGANVDAEGPAPYGNTHGKRTTREYDSKGRLEKNSVWKYSPSAWTELAYARYVFPNNGIESQVYSTLVDVGDPGLSSEDEVLTDSFYDGAGRVRATRNPHPGSANGWAAVKTEYDSLGRITRQSAPTEVDVNDPLDPEQWVAAGDDAGFLWTYQKYDWKGRVVRKINTDGADSPTANDSDIFISYTGCGCAGGLITTIESERVPIPDDPENDTARRTQKIYQDILGRTKKTETFKWNGSDVYLRTEVELNGRDQATTVTQTDLTNSGSPVTQSTTMTYDGHGRLYQSHKPEQFVGGTLKYTTYSYNEDDSISTVTDGRGAVTTYTYENDSGTPKRPLVTGIGWTVPGGSGITDPSDVSFTYDNAGNRISMTDGLGSVSYAYNSLSQMTNETRTFSDTLSEVLSGNYDLDYTYEIGGQLKSIKDPWEKETDYAYDLVGRLNNVSPSTETGGLDTYLQNPLYRAWGGLKHLEYGNALKSDLTYDSALRPDTYKLQKTGSDAAMQKGYQYYADGKLKFVDDVLNGIFDRGQTYDHQGRVVTGKSSTEASGTLVTSDFDTTLPYRQGYTYDAFDHLLTRDNFHWGESEWGFVSNNLSYSYTNNRVDGWTYDADGRATVSVENTNTTTQEYDANGMLVQTSEPGDYPSDSRVDRLYSGDGREGRRLRRHFNDNTAQWVVAETTYYVRSTVLGGEVVSEVGATGKKTNTNIYAAGTKLAVQSEYIYDSTTTESVVFEHFDASGMSHRSSLSNGFPIVASGDFEGAPAEMDPLGGNVGTETPYVLEPAPLPDPGPLAPMFPMDGDAPLMINGQQVTCTLDGMSIGCGTAMGMLGSGSAIPAILEPYQNYPGFSFQDHGLGIFSFGFWYGETQVAGQFSFLAMWSGVLQPPAAPDPPSTGHGVGTSGKPNDKISPDCEKAVKYLGEDIWAQVQDLMKAPPLIDIESTPSLFDLRSGTIEQDMGDKYFTSLLAKKGETAGSAFNRNNGGPDGAWTVRGPNTVAGIYYRGSRTSFSGNVHFLLHEVLHYVFPTLISSTLGSHADLDETLALALNVRVDKGQSYSQALDRYFQSGCNKKYGGPR